MSKGRKVHYLRLASLLFVENGGKGSEKTGKADVLIPLKSLLVSC
jgi:hypothetical protein